MSCYFIDFENVNSSGLTGISKLKFDKNDELYIFYSENAKTMTIDLHKELEKTTVKKEYIKVTVGTKNALDFQLSSYIGYCINKNNKKIYFIISKDSGFDAVCKFWNGRNVAIKRIDSITCIDKNLETETKILNGIVDEKQSIEIFKIINSYKTKLAIHNNIMKLYDNKKTTEIYNAIKPLLKDKK